MNASHRLPPLQIAIVQPPMSWTTAGNLAHILSALASSAAQGAQLVLFPELALTGFHRGIREQGTPAMVEPALQQVQAACAELDIACALGLPTFGGPGIVFNSYSLIDDAGHIVSTVEKNGLTPAEATFCTAGTERAVTRFADRACTTVMCREVEDLEKVAGQLVDRPVDLVFWPSLVGHHPGTMLERPEDSDDLGYLNRTVLLARRLEAFVVQSNWPVALNTPDSSHLGESKVYAPDGEVLLTLPRDAAGIGLFTLGARGFQWTPLTA